MVTDFSKNGKSANNKNAASDLTNVANDLSNTQQRFSELEIQPYMYDVKYDSKHSKVPFTEQDRFTITATSKDAHRSYVNAVRGISKSYANGKNPFVILKGIQLLMLTLNKGISLHYCITHKSTKAEDVEYSDGCYFDYDAFGVDETTKEKYQFFNAATLEQLLALPTIQSYCNFYQASFKGLPNCHFHMTYSRRCNYQEHQILLTLGTIKLNEELPKGIHQGFDDSLETNSTHVCYAGKTDCVTLDRIPGLDNEFGLLIPVDEWLEEAKKRGITVKGQFIKANCTKKVDTTTNSNNESPLEYLERVIGKQKFDGNFALWFSKHSKYPGDTWVTGSRGETHLEGWNRFSDTDSSGSGFYCKKNDDRLPPVWASTVEVKGNDRKGGDVVTYWYLVGREEGRFITGGVKANYKAVVDFICDYHEVPRYQWSAKKKKKTDDNEEDNRTILEIYYEMMEDRFNGRARLNEMTLKLHIDDKEINKDTFLITLNREYDLKFNLKPDAWEAFTYLAKQNKYHPVREYLTNLVNATPNSSELQAKLSNISSRYFNTTNPLFDIYLKKQLIGSVARVFEPGCHLKTITVLQGAQDAGKSQWIKYLAGRDWFSSDLDIAGGNNKDTKLMVNAAWHHEVAEIDQYFRKSDRSSVKSFLANPSDMFRAPYSADTNLHDRTSVFWGSTNEQQILDDATGSVRFWCVPVNTNTIDFEGVIAERDILWCAATHAYLNGEQWWLNKDEEKMRDKANESFTKSDPWEDNILNFASRFDAISFKYIYRLLDIQEKDKSKIIDNRIRDIFTKNGWVYDAKQIKKLGQLLRLWHNPDKQNKISYVELIHAEKSGSNVYDNFVYNLMGVVREDSPI